MSQAKVLNEKEMRKVLLYVANHKHASRNKAMLLCTHLSGMRVGEVAALKISDVLNTDGSIKDEVRLSVDQTKGSSPRTVLLPQRLQEEIHHYLSVRFRLKSLAAIYYTDTDRALFNTQKEPIRGFTSSTLSQYFHYLYKNAGVEGASSHSGRRGFITSLANKGVSVRVLMALAAHKNLSTTQRYIELNPSMMRSAVEMMN
ncbi:MAG: site-specific integrase [bacterium]